MGLRDNFLGITGRKTSIVSALSQFPAPIQMNFTRAHV